MKDNSITQNLKGLTTEGIIYQMISALRTHKELERGTVNDCQVVLNHLIRKYSEPLKRDKKQIIYYSEGLKRLKPGEKKIREHVIPVKTIMQYLLNLNLEIGDKNLKNTIEKYLNENLIIVYLTHDEDKMLTRIGIKDSMPQEYSNQNSEYYQDKWARYKVAGICETLYSKKNNLNYED